jgi:hypothetical protein
MTRLPAIRGGARPSFHAPPGEGEGEGEGGGGGRGEALVFEGLRSPPESIELRCLHQELGRGVLIGIGTLQLSGLDGGGGDPVQQPRPDGTSPWELEASSVELRDDRGKPAGSIEVQLAWLPRRKARKQVGGGRPSLLTVGVIRGEDIRSPWGSRYEPYKGRYDDPYCVVRVGTVRERSPAARPLENAPDRLTKNAPPRFFVVAQTTLRTYTMSQLVGRRVAQKASRDLTIVAAEASISRAREADAKLAKDELWEFAEHLGLEVDSEPHLLWVAQEAAHSCAENRPDCLLRRPGHIHLGCPDIRRVGWDVQGFAEGLGGSTTGER